MKINKKISILLLLAMIPVLVLSFIDSNKYRKLIIDKEKNQIQNVCDEISDFGELLIGTMKQIISILVLEESIQNLDEKASCVIFNEILKNSQFDFLFFTDTEGKILAHSSGNKDFLLRDRTYIQEALAGKTNFSGYVLSKRTGKPVLVLSSPIIKNKIIVGVLVIGVNIDRFASFVQTKNYSRDIHIRLLDHNGVIIYNNQDFNSMDYSIVGMVFDQQLLVELNNDAFIYKTEEGTLYFLKNLEYLDKLYLSIIVSVTERVLNREANTIFINQVFLIISLFMLVILITNILCRLYITNGINKLVATACEIGKGELKHTEIKHDSSEIGILAKTIDKMIDSIIEREKDKFEIELQLFDIGKRLKQSQKMEALGSFSNKIAHDFNNVLHIIENLVILLMDKCTDPKLFTKISDAIKKAKDLINQIMLFSKPKDSTARRINIGLVLEEACVLVQPLVKSSILYKRNIKTNLHTIELMLDPTHIHQIILNLVSNSIAAMENGTLLIEALKTNGYIEIVVSDTGKGIPLDIIDRVIEPYYTTKEEGTGLGLAVVHSLVKNYNGDLEIKSSEAGTTISIRLPITEKQKKLILLVDDNESVLSLMVNMLRRLNYEVIASRSSEEAFDLIKNKDFDLLITDYNMPKITGIELAVASKAIKNIKIILYSGFMELIKKQDLKIVDKFLPKPVSFSELSISIKKLLDKD